VTGEPLLLGIDAGTSTMKALLVDRGGRERALATVPTPFVTGGSGTEMTAEAFLGTLAGLIAGLGPTLGDVVAVGIAGLGESGVPMGRGGEPLAPVIAWHDSRGAETVAALERAFGPDLALRTGQRPRTVSSVAKLGWLTNNRLCSSDIRRWLGVAELALRRLTGVEATEHSFASRTGCYDVVERVWIPEVARVAGVPVSVFPPVHPAGSSMGIVTEEAAAWSGLVAGIPVTLAGHDHLAGAAGAGAGAEDLVNSVGTAETVLRHLDRIPDLARVVELRGAVSVRPGGSGWSVMTGAARSGVVLGRAATALGRPAAELDALAADAQTISADGLVVALQERGEAALPDGEPGTIWRGLLEALTRRTFEAAERLQAIAGPPDRVLAFGGGTRSAPWMTIKAGLSPHPVVVPRITEAAGRGAALFAGVAAGWWRCVEDAPAPALDLR
jgi:sugar (pentulose or hexulose) kinase